jgi:rubrerythrin
VARLFRAAAAAETVHANNHLRAMRGVGSTEENLRDAIAGETHEFKNMYPAMIEHSVADKHPQAERSFRYANAVEKTHAELYEAALDGLDAGGEEYPYFVCPVCGHTVGREAPENCPVCGAAGRVFIRIE